MNETLARLLDATREDSLLREELLAALGWVWLAGFGEGERSDVHFL